MEALHTILCPMCIFHLVVLDLHPFKEIGYREQSAFLSSVSSKKLPKLRTGFGNPLKVELAIQKTCDKLGLVTEN